MSTEPIYEVMAGRLRKRTNGNTIVQFGRGDLEHICRLLNADPLPQDKLKRYSVSTSIAGSSIVDEENPCGSDAAWFCKRTYPDHPQRAQEECDRLNGLAHV